MDIQVEDLNKAGTKQDTFIYKLTSDKYNYPATIYRQGINSTGEEFSYSYYGKKETEFSHWTASVPVVLESLSKNGYVWQSMDDVYVLEPGQSVYLKFKAVDKVTYLDKSQMWLDIGYGAMNGRVQAGCIWVNHDTGEGYYSFDY